MSARPEAETDARLAADLGLVEAEWLRILELLGRRPNHTELGIFSAMWNEHCSYKSSRKWLRELPVEGPQVVHGPGENAGVVEIGDGKVVIFKIESHNHPSYIEPYQGAATGVGGILRDVFAMGARPVAALNALRFGDPAHPKTRHLIGGVVAGIGGYGNSFGVPTVGGEIGFDRSYDGNCLVNAFVAGIAERDHVFTASAAGTGRPVVYLGAKTGRDGVGGATMASAGFGEESEGQRPTVQIGDPFAEKRLCEACLELMAGGAIESIQDMGAAGLTCAASEMGAASGVGIELDLDAVPCREPNMSAYEMMLSESQERMLVVLRPEKETLAREVFAKWDLDFATVGRTEPGNRLRVLRGGQTAADLPLSALIDEAPVYDRPWTEIKPAEAPPVGAVTGTAEALRRLIGSPALASRRWIWEQYDHMVMADTVQRPGGDAAVVRIHGTDRALAFSLDSNPHYCSADPYEGGKQAVAEACRNLSAAGARPLAITDCLNFGNPERPEVMGQFVGCIRGIGDACRALGVPVVSGNVSLYNQTGDTTVLPTPVIGAVGLLDPIERMLAPALPGPDFVLLLVGASDGHLHQSLYARLLAGREDGPPPPVDLAAEKANADFIRMLAEDGTAAACHDLSDGGLAPAATEMALAGKCGVSLDPPGDGIPAHAWYFGESQARYLVAVPEAAAETVLDRAREAAVPAARVGHSLETATVVLDGERLDLEELRALHENWLPDYVSGAPVPGGGIADVDAKD